MIEAESRAEDAEGKVRKKDKLLIHLNMKRVMGTLMIKRSGYLMMPISLWVVNLSAFRCRKLLPFLLEQHFDALQYGGIFSHFHLNETFMTAQQLLLVAVPMSVKSAKALKGRQR